MSHVSPSRPSSRPMQGPASGAPDELDDDDADDITAEELVDDIADELEAATDDDVAEADDGDALLALELAVDEDEPLTWKPHPGRTRVHNPPMQSVSIGHTWLESQKVSTWTQRPRV